jgi:erythronate-4-phosphate dehydrogenase
MKIIADDKMPGLEQWLGEFGTIEKVPGREIDQAVLRDADVLLVRSITPVNAKLLADSKLRFVGSATSGLDHVDSDYLQARGIRLADARGANADAVVDYCLAVLGLLLSRGDLPQLPASAGIIGAGEVGSRLTQRLRRLGITVKLCDPPLKEKLVRSGENAVAAQLLDKDALHDCELLSLHLPLTEQGPHPSRKLLDKDFLAAMEKSALLINAARGGVVDEAALLALAKNGEAPLCAFDVWEHEPAVNPEMVACCTLATPHIAGYSQRAKQQATRALAQQLKRYIEQPDLQQDQDSLHLQANLQRLKEPQAASRADSPALWQVLGTALPLQQLSEDFKQAVARNAEQGMSGAEFDGFRAKLLNRQEFCEMPAAGDPALQALQRAAGFARQTAG